MTTNAVPAHEQSEATVNQALHLFKIPQTDVSINATRLLKETQLEIKK